MLNVHLYKQPSKETDLTLFFIYIKSHTPYISTEKTLKKKIMLQYLQEKKYYWYSWSTSIKFFNFRIDVTYCFKASLFHWLCVITGSIFLETSSAPGIEWWDMVMCVSNTANMELRCCHKPTTDRQDQACCLQTHCPVMAETQRWRSKSTGECPNHSLVL